jgi:hypothetical protein
MSDAAQAGGPSIRWDSSAAHSQASTMAVARTVADRVVVSFGVRTGVDQPGREQGVALLRRIALHPMTAKNLHDMLGRLIADAGAVARKPG